MRRISPLVGLLAVAVLVPAVPALASEPPTVELIEPESFTQYQAPATIEMTAVADDPDGTVTRVEFYADGQLLGTDFEAPYAWTLAGVNAPEEAIALRLRARAYDGDDQSTESAGALVFVFPPPMDEIVVTGSVREREAGCRYLDTEETTYLLEGGDPEVLQGGNQVVVRGIPQPTWETICFETAPYLEVTSAELLD